MQKKWFYRVLRECCNPPNPPRRGMKTQRKYMKQNIKDIKEKSRLIGIGEETL